MIVDSHLDLAMNALYLNRDLRMSAHELREVERAAGRMGNGLGRATTGLPDLRRGGVGLSFVTVLARVNPAGTSFLDFATPEIAHAQGQAQLAWWLELERQGDCRTIRTRADLDAHLAEWGDDGSPSSPTLSRDRERGARCCLSRSRDRGEIPQGVRWGSCCRWRGRTRSWGRTGSARGWSRDCGSYRWRTMGRVGTRTGPRARVGCSRWVGSCWRRCLGSG